MEAINSSAGAVVPSHSGFMSIKLDKTNYPLWLAQIVPIIKSKNLMGFVTSTNPCPPEFKCNTDSTVTTKVDPRKPVDDDEVVNIILNNVGPAYEVTVSSAQACDTSISYDDLVALLLNVEMRLKAQQTPSLEASPTAMYAPKATQSNNRGRNSVHHRGSNMRGREPSGFRRNQNWSQPQSGSVSFETASPDFNSPLEIVTEPLPHIPLASTGSPNTTITPPDPPTQNPPTVPTTSITPTTNILITPPIITEPT
ncbi:hypothetical protein FCV25MIE_27840 [Fagus crenata]